MFIHKLPFQRKRYEKLGIDIKKEMNRAFGDRSYGLSTTVSGGATVGILFIFIMAVTLLTIKAAKWDITLTAIHFVIFGLSSTLACYFFVLKNNNYLRYFEVYDKWDKKEKWKYGGLSLMFTIAVIFLFFLSL